MTETILQNGKHERKLEVKFSITLSEEQKKAKELILQHPFNFIIGKVGSGKTILAAHVALDLLFKGKVDKIVVTRPTVSTEDNGFLPGSLAEKMEPWLVPIYSNFLKVYDKSDKMKKLEDEKKIEVVALTHFRGRTFDNAICIIDEFQNLSKNQLAMVLGRLGKNSIMILTGDTQQIDLKVRSESAIHTLDRLNESKYVSKIILIENHRHPALDEVLGLLEQ